MLGQLAVATPNGHRIVACQVGGSIPKGLALTLVPLNTDEAVDAPPYGDARWSVSHIQSGMRIGPGMERRGDAQRIAESLGRMDVDWTLPGFALRALPGITDEIDAALDTVLTEIGAES